MSAAQLRGYRVLIVDDDRLITSTLQAGLAVHGLEVVTANSVREAQSCLDEVGVDLVIIDTKMPEQTGIDLAAWIRATEREVPYLFLSAYADADSVTEAVAQGALTYVVKPVQVAQLLPVIHAALQRGMDLRDLRDAADRLAGAVQSNRDISVAVGLLMARSGLTRDEAFERLRKHCRDEGLKMRDMAARLIAADELLSLTARQQI